MLHSILIAGGNEEERFKKALSLRQQLNSETLKPLNPLTVNNDPDFIILDSETSIGIKQIRELKIKVNLKPFQNPYKIALLARAERLTLPAQNALLKLLEEPPAQTMIILDSASADSLLPTIQSRCQLIQLPSKTQIDFSQEELANTIQFITNLIKKGAGERLLLIQPSLKDRETAIEFCQKAMLALHPRLTQFVKLVKSLQNSLSLMQQNVNTKLVMENMVLSW